MLLRGVGAGVGGGIVQAGGPRKHDEHQGASQTVDFPNNCHLRPAVAVDRHHCSMHRETTDITPQYKENAPQESMQGELRCHRFKYLRGAADNFYVCKELS